MRREPRLAHYRVDVAWPIRGTNAPSIPLCPEKMTSGAKLLPNPGGGLAEVLQQAPLAVTAAPPPAVTVPPLDAVVEVMAVTAAVVTVGGIAFVVNEACAV
jgi:hypothetical protein